MAYFLGGGGHGRNLIFPIQPPLAYHVLHYHFCHGRTADIAVADEKNFDHGHETPFYAEICRFIADLQASHVHINQYKILQKNGIIYPIVVVKMVVK